MIVIENHQIIYLKRKFYEATEDRANYWNKSYNPASYYAHLNSEFGNLRYYLHRCLYKKATRQQQALTFRPDGIIPLNELDTLPQQPGVYAFFTIEKECLYVGASKNVRKRVIEHRCKKNNDLCIAYWLTEPDQQFSLEKVILVSLHPTKNVQYRSDILPKWCNPVKVWNENSWP